MNLPKKNLYFRQKPENKLQKVQIFNYCTDIFGLLEIHVGWVITVNAHNTTNNPTKLLVNIIWSVSQFSILQNSQTSISMVNEALHLAMPSCKRPQLASLS